jgi:hypothetical protein
MPIEKFQTQEGGKTQDCYIVSTPEEAKDSSYMDYLKEAEQEKFSDKVKHEPEKPEPKFGREHAVGVVRELKEYKEWHKRNPNSKRYY